jgi:hypothetical protein
MCASDDGVRFSAVSLTGTASDPQDGPMWRSEDSGVTWMQEQSATNFRILKCSEDGYTRSAFQNTPAGYGYQGFLGTRGAWHKLDKYGYFSTSWTKSWQALSCSTDGKQCWPRSGHCHIQEFREFNTNLLGIY